MVDDAKSVPRATSHLADTVPERDSEKTTNAFRGPIASRKNDSMTLIGGKHVNPRLRARNIFHQHELSAVPVSSLLAEHYDQLQRKRDFPV